MSATDTDGVFDLCYRRHVLSTLDLHQNVAKPIHNVPEHLSTYLPGLNARAGHPRPTSRVDC
ncbi:hypothetical protein [Xanthobacter sediminis]